MNFRRLFVVVCVVVLALAFGCKKREQVAVDRGVDLVNGITPVSTDFAHMRVTVEELARMEPQVRLARLQHDWPNLQESLVYFLRERGRLRRDQNVRQVDFRFGSLEGVEAEDATGRRHRGYFENQLVARVHLTDVERPIDVLVNCLNGLFALPGELDRLQPLYTAAPQQRFRIARREGLIHHVDPSLAIALAERFHLPLYRGRRMRQAARITPAVARTLLPTTDRTQVTVQVYTGDQFDLVAMTYTPARRRGRG